MNSEVKTLEELLETAVTPGERGVDPNRVRRAIITGGSTGLGRYIAIALAKDNCDVAITYAHNRDDAELTAKAVESFGRRCVIEQLDLEQPQTAEPAIDKMVEALGGLDIFVSNAGTMVMQKMPGIDLEHLEKLFRINTFGAVLGCQHAFRHMLNLFDAEDSGPLEQVKDKLAQFTKQHIAKPRETPGRIILITSTHEHVASPVDSVYTMSKHALGGFIKTAAFDCKGLNITVNGIRPGEIATPINNMHPEDATDTKRTTLPAERAGHPMEIAEAVRFLADDASSFITGVSYDVGGGIAIGQPMALDAYRQAVKS